MSSTDSNKLKFANNHLHLFISLPPLNHHHHHLSPLILASTTQPRNHALEHQNSQMEQMQMEQKWNSD